MFKVIAERFPLPINFARGILRNGFKRQGADCLQHLRVITVLVRNRIPFSLRFNRSGETFDLIEKKWVGQNAPPVDHNHASQRDVALNWLVRVNVDASGKLRDPLHQRGADGLELFGMRLQIL